MAIGDEIIEAARPRIKLDQQAPDLREQGADLNLPFVSPFKNQWELQRVEDVNVEKLVAMRKTDGQARALYRLIVLPILSALKGSTIAPMDGKEGGKDEAEFIDKVLNLPHRSGGMEITLRKVMEHFLLGVFDGFSAAELVIHSPAFGPLQDKWTIKTIAPRPPETLTFVVDGRGKFKGIRQRAYIAGHSIDVTIPKERALYYAAQEAENPYYGHSFFHPAFFAWDKKVRLYYLGHLMAQRSAVGTRVGTYPKTADPKKVRNFIKQLSDLGTNQWMAVEELFEVDSLKEGGSFDFLGLINHYNSQMSTSLLAQFMDKNQGAGQNDGSFVDFGEQSDALFQLMLDSIIGDLEDIVNHKIIPDLINWNFNSGMYPTFKWGPVSQDQRQQVVEIFKTLMVGAPQGNVSPDFVHEAERLTAKAMGMEHLDYDKIKREAEEKRVKEEAQAEKMQQQQDAMAEAQLAAMQPQETGGADIAGQALNIAPDLLPEGFQ